MEEKNKSIETMHNYVVTKSNQLVQANYKLSVIEQKIVLFLVSKIRKDDEDFKTYTLSIKEFNELLGNKGTPKYSELREITKKLLGKVLEIWEDDKLKQMGWISYVEYNKSEGSISLSFDPRLKPYLLQLKKEFTSYKLKNVMQLKSSYSIRIYEILKQWQKVKKTEITLEKLRKLLGVEDKYKEYHNFKKRVLNRAKKEINQNTDIDFDFEEIKKGRMVVAIRFHIKSEQILIEQQNEDNSKDKEEPNVDLAQSLLVEIRDLLAKYEYNEQLKEETLKRWIILAEKHWKEEKYKKIKQLVSSSLENMEKIDNLFGFITYMIQEGKDEILPTPKNRKKQKEVLPNWFDKQKEGKELSEKEIEEIQKEKEELEEALKKLASR